MAMGCALALTVSKEFRNNAAGLAWQGTKSNKETRRRQNERRSDEAEDDGGLEKLPA